MTFHVLNLTSCELIAVLHECEIAIAYARELAREHGWKERFGVVELVLIHETPLRNGEADE